MPYGVNIADTAQLLNLQDCANVTSSGNGTGVDLQDYDGEAIAILKVGAATAGTNPTMDCKLQESADDSTYTDVSGGGFTQVTTTASQQKISLNTDELKRYVRLVKTIGGTSSPSFPMSAKIVAWKKNPA